MSKEKVIKQYKNTLIYQLTWSMNKLSTSLNHDGGKGHVFMCKNLSVAALHWSFVRTWHATKDSCQGSSDGRLFCHI